jgi:hypothetical protein
MIQFVTLFAIFVGFVGIMKMVSRCIARKVTVKHLVMAWDIVLNLNAGSMKKDRNVAL